MLAGSRGRERCPLGSAVINLSTYRKGTDLPDLVLTSEEETKA